MCQIRIMKFVQTQIIYLLFDPISQEDKFGDDRSVEFRYMPDLSIENARNVSINLKEEHGQYVMIQLYFAAKWILISEVTFVSGESL